MKIEITKNELVISLEGGEKLWALKSQLKLSKDIISKVSWSNELPDRKSLRGLRSPGTSLPGLFFAGSFYQRKGWEFWYLKMRSPGVLIIETTKKRYCTVRLSIDQAVAEKVIDWFNTHQHLRNYA